MPQSLLLLFYGAGAGVVLCIVMLAVNGFVVGKGRKILREKMEIAASDSARGAVYDPEEEAAQPLPAMQEAPTVYGDAQGITIASLSVRVGNAQLMGTRPEQQDAFAITPIDDPALLASHGLMAVVCDGMGGLSDGARASQDAVLRFMSEYLRGEGPAALHDAVLLAGQEIFQLAGGQEGTLGTTLCAAAITEEGLRFLSVGDSHIYLSRGGKLYQLNHDHNYYALLLKDVEKGTMTLEEARRHPERAHLTSYLGQETLFAIDENQKPLALRAGDRLLLCTDGLYKTLPPATLQSLLAQPDAEDRLMDAVTQAARPRQDNATAVVLYLD